MLKISFEVDIIEEYSKLEEHNKISINKILNLIKNNLQILTNSLIHGYDYFYLIFSLSTFGSIKTLTAIISFRLFNRGKVVLHIHRGDFFTRFYKTLINRIITKLIFGLTHKIIVLSDNQKTEFEALFNRPFNVLSNTVEFEYTKEKECTQNCNFIFISNYLLDKGIIDLLEVFTRLTREYQKISLQTYGSFSDQSLKDKILKYKSLNISINGSISGVSKFKEIADRKSVV